MAIRYAVASGNWSNTATWDGGVSVPTSADDVYANNFVVTVNVTASVLSIRNTAVASPVVTAGGSFALSDGCNLTCTTTIANSGGGSGTFLVTCSISVGQTSTINANIQGGASVSRYGLSYSGSGTLYINGNVAAGVGGGGGLAHGVICGGSGNVYIVGNYTPTSNSQNVASSILVNGVNTVYVTGNGTGSNFVTSFGINLTSSANVYVTGTLTGGSASPIIINSGTGLISFTGDIFGTAASALNNSSVGQITCIGNLYAVSGNAIASTSTGTIVHTGTSTAANNFPAISSSNTGATVILSGPFLTSANGTHAIFCARWFWQNSSPPATYYQIRTANLATIRPLYTADSVGGNPAASNVRLGTVYGPSSELTGTMAVPPAASVNFGVPVDNTTGTALVTASSVINAIWNHPISGITTSGSIGERLKNTATVDAVNSILSNGLR